MTQTGENPYRSPVQQSSLESPARKPFGGWVVLAIVGVVAAFCCYAAALLMMGSVAAEILSDIGNACMLISVFLVVLRSHLDQRTLLDCCPAEET